MIDIYMDGGVILRNPSPHGGTWAFVVVKGDRVIKKESGAFFPSSMQSSTVTNNQAELVAAYHALKYLADDEMAHLYSDSEVTLGRLFYGYEMNNVPDWLKDELSAHKKRLQYFSTFKHTLLAGHPHRLSLTKGTDKRGRPVSKYNVMCDEMCRMRAEKYIAKKNLRRIYA
jgi:ribonuclease HI